MNSFLNDAPGSSLLDEDAYPGPDPDGPKPEGGHGDHDHGDYIIDDGAPLPKDGTLLGSSTADSATAYNIDLVYTGPAAFQDEFDTAIAIWEAIITADLPDRPLDGQLVDDLRITATIEEIDGPGQILGSAGPTNLRGDSFLPFAGRMRFDTADIANLDAQGTLQNVIIHEIGHIIGIGTLFERTGNADDFLRYIGPAALAEYQALTGSDNAYVPIEEDGGPGTAGGHWDETLFDAEMMTGFVEGGGRAMPISRVTIASLQDMGYTVDLNQAEAFVLPLGAPVDDFAGSALSTGALVQNGTTITGQIGTGGDTDWFAVTLVAGMTYQVDLLGIGGLDTFLYQISGPDGQALAGAQNDDVTPGVDTNSQITFTPTVSGVHFVEAGAFAARTGSYSVRITETTPADIEVRDTFGTLQATAPTLASAFSLVREGANVIVPDGVALAQSSVVVGQDDVGLTSGVQAQKSSIALGAGVQTFTLLGSGAFDLAGNADANAISGAAGSDLIEGGDGADTLFGGEQTAVGDTLSYASSDAGVTVNLSNGAALAGHAQGDVIRGFENLSGSSLDDRLTGSDIANGIEGGFGGDLLAGLGADDTISGGNGADSIAGGDGNDILLGGATGDRLFGNAGNDTILGGPGDDTTNGGAGDDSIFGGEDSDAVLVGGAGNDTLYGGAGDDGLNGSADDDQLFGEAGNDRLFGGQGDDALNGGAENDTLAGQSGADTLRGDDGNDGLNGGAGADDLNGGAADDRLYGAQGADTLSGEAGADTLSGGSEDDLLSGGAGDDGLNGGTGRDLINGDGGADRLFAGTGNDTLDGGADDDLLVGQDGIDTFVFGANWGQDSIADYGVGTLGQPLVDEVIDLSALGIVFDDLTIQQEGPHSLIFITADGSASNTISVLFRHADSLTADDFFFGV